MKFNSYVEFRVAVPDKTKSFLYRYRLALDVYVNMYINRKLTRGRKRHFTVKNYEGNDPVKGNYLAKRILLKKTPKDGIIEKIIWIPQ